jgi:uncharacterized protein (DUF362 family)
MLRRTFLKGSLETVLLAGTGTALGPLAGARAEEPHKLPYDLVAVKGATPDRLFDAAIEAQGGMRAFVRPGQTVVVKPNIAWDVPPERAANTNPLLVQRIVEHCRAAGAKAVYVFDYTCDSWQRTYRTSGIEAAVKAAGGTMAPGDGAGYFHPVTVGGRSLRDAREHELILESDVFINVPVLKSHGSAGVTVAMKNLMGTIWDRQYWHAHDLHQCIADFATYRKPTLNVVDAWGVMVQHGPRGISEQDVVRMESLLLSADMVAADAAATRLMGLDPDTVGHIRIAAAQGAGRKDLDSLTIKRIKL